MHARPDTSRMRELIYLSERKLQQFQDDSSRGSMLRRIQQFGAKGPAGLGELSVSLSPDTAKKHATLTQAINHIDYCDRPARWYEDDGLQPGDWLHFEARLSYSVVTIAGTEGPLLFREPQSADRRVGLLLHGSEQHLVCAAPPEVGHDLWYSWAYPFQRFMRSIKEDEEGVETRGLGRSLSLPLRRLAIQGGEEFASRMAGYARISAIIYVERGQSATQSCVIASPLYVEYTSPPDTA
jgi:hypothetical protein